ncbi:AAA family ATPase [Chryseobacterium sp. RP-3-3]|uniref:AAA family ATPase n=2 Tax=Chryseobacterium antibioticum TaxID=2728847 RepID=A0A7Y0FU55_9FLAO|nr:AAA family ATPase [Chryseobacterium antibioticum]
MYLSKINVSNYKGIADLDVCFSPKINIIIGENGCCKSALIDAIRLLYNIGEPTREITVSKEDFHERIIPLQAGGLSIDRSKLIHIVYEFHELSSEQKGAFYEYMVVDPANQGNDFARIEIQYKDDEKRFPIFSYATGNIDGQKADINTFGLFQHYYLSAIRDSTKDLLTVRGNILGKVIKRLVDRNGSEDKIKNIIKGANDQLLQQSEVVDTKTNINTNLYNIYKHADKSAIGLHIEQSKIEYIVNVIKPYLPHDWENNSVEGFQLWQNSLGFNNLIYIATVLGDIKERVYDDKIPHYTLLIEEPEAHIHPQLQLSLYNFLKEANSQAQSQLFITTHSPTLTSKVPFENLILLDKYAYSIGHIFDSRATENLIQDTAKAIVLTQAEIDLKKKQLQRYLDVTKSQLFYAKSCLFVEGISEELLITAFCQVCGFNLEDYRIELVNVDGISFYPFMFLFNSTDAKKRLPKKIAILTDDDRYPISKKKEYNLDKLVENNYQMLNDLHNKITTEIACNRIANLNSITNGQSSILVSTAIQTMEYDLCRNNILGTKTATTQNFLNKYVMANYPSEMAEVTAFMRTLPEDLNDTHQEKIAVLLWKCLPGKALLAQDFSYHILENMDDAKVNFIVPTYIQAAFNHLKS